MNHNIINEEREEEVGEVVKMSEELNKPDELKSDNDNDYINLINGKIKEYKRDLDKTIDKIEINKKELTEQEKKFNNFIETINISNKIINYITASVNNTKRELEEISTNQDKIIDDLDEIEKNLDKKIRGKGSDEQVLNRIVEKNKKIENTFDNIEKMIKKSHEKMKTNNNVVEDKEIISLNQLLNRIHCRIKKDIQGKQIDYLNKIFDTEENYISEN